MKSLFQTTAVAFCGLVTSILTALAVVLVHNLFGIDIFTFSFWVVVPAGAVVTGMAAASGYYFGSLYFHKRPNKMLFLQMLVIAAFTQVLIYYLEYTTLVLDNGVKASALVPFSEYLDISLTKAHYRIGRGSGVDTGEVGRFGYWLAIFQFIGFMVGGVSIYFILLARPECKKCQKYLRPLASKTKSFSSTDDFAAYYDGIFQHPVDSESFASMIGQAYIVTKPAKGTLNLEEKLYGCPQCKMQMLANIVKIFNGEDWKDVDKLERRVEIRDGINLVGLFKA